MPYGYVMELKVRHSAGRGLYVGLAGIALLLLSFFATPWVSPAGGDDLSFKDLRDLFHPDSSPSSAAGPTVTTTTPDLGTTPGLETDTSLPPIGNPVTPPLPDAGSLPGAGSLPDTPSTPTFDDSSSSSRSDAADQLESFTGTGWIWALYLAVAGVVFSTWIVPSDRSGRLITGILTAGCLGIVNLFDKDGTSAPRVLSTLANLVGAALVIGNCWNLFWRFDGSPDAAFGAYVGCAGSIAVLVACVMGSKRTWYHVPAPMAVAAPVRPR
jgi:hypothetical protein